MSADRELLELAAKAYWGNEIDDVCSIRWLDEDQAIGYTHADNQDHNGRDIEWCWNPLTDDGDALRLAVKLNIDVCTDGQIGTQDDAPNAVVCGWFERKANGMKVFKQLGEVYQDDLYATTRRAIVRAAADIGKAMP